MNLIEENFKELGFIKKSLDENTFKYSKQGIDIIFKKKEKAYLIIHKVYTPNYTKLPNELLDLIEAQIKDLYWQAASNADELLVALGYIKNSKCSTEAIQTYTNEAFYKIRFDLEKQEVSVDENISDNWSFMKSKLIKAISKKIEELGWS